jgi:multidrug efflux pump
VDAAGDRILVMVVVFAFLRRIHRPSRQAFPCRWHWLAAPACGWPVLIDNLSLMALAISVGFVVDDAIVMIETCTAISSVACSRIRRRSSAKQIGFTVLSISLSLIATFTR